MDLIKLTIDNRLCTNHIRVKWKKFPTLQLAGLENVTQD